MTPWRITIDTNPDLCNLHCLMCDTHSPYNHTFGIDRTPMSMDMLGRVLKNAGQSGVSEVIPTTMGEPLLYSDFDLFLELLKRYSLKLNLTTNGTFPRGGVPFWGRRILEVASDVKISLNGISPEVNESIMIGSRTETALSNIKAFLAVRNQIVKEGINTPTVTLQMTFMRANFTEMKRVVEFAAENGIDRVKGHHLWVTWDELQKEAIPGDQEAVAAWNKLIEGLVHYRSSVKLENFEKIAVSQESEVIPHDYECPFLGKELWVDHDGTYNVCCAPSKLRRQLGDFGSVEVSDIQGIFNSDQYQDLVHNYKERDLCKCCLLRRKK